MSSKPWICLVPVSLLLAGCVNEQIGKRDPSLGEAVKYNAAMQTISPDPIYPEGSAQPGDIGGNPLRLARRIDDIDVVGRNFLFVGDAQDFAAYRPVLHRRVFIE